MAFEFQSQKELLSRREAATALGVSIYSLGRWARDGKGPRYFWVGGRVKYAAADLDDFIRRNVCNPASERGPPDIPKSDPNS